MEIKILVENPMMRCTEERWSGRISTELYSSWAFGIKIHKRCSYIYTIYNKSLQCNQVFKRIGNLHGQVKKATDCLDPNATNPLHSSGQSFLDE